FNPTPQTHFLLRLVGSFLFIIDWTALLAPDRAAVDAAYEIALAHGGRGDGAPGLRPDYHEHYYGAYVRDPDGNKLCVVCHDPA
ncbi:VOC family protein, partial [Massilia sp. CT11-108]|uniref:VOC family protein n=1 Tax=Massilia sp. CT11-108 TaxID=3393900 RepID=UPI0039A5DF76